MAQPKVGGRRIVVDGVAYVWRVRPHPTYDEGLCWAPMSFSARAAEGAGSTLRARLDRVRPNHWLNLSGPATRPLLPSEVASTIRGALAAGWKPGATGPAFDLGPPAGE